MAKRIEVRVDGCDGEEALNQVLKYYDLEWVLVAVIPKTERGHSSETGNWEEEWRELWFEKAEKFNTPRMFFGPR